MFNCKPDIMIISKKNIVMIEGKMESSEDKSRDGYNQFEIQEKMIKLFLHLSDRYLGFVSANLQLELFGSSLTWKEIGLIAEQSKEELDSFTVKGLQGMYL